MRWEYRERFHRHRLQRKPLVNDPGMHHGTCVTHVPWCMSESQTSGGGENVPGTPGACASRNFTYLARGLWMQTSQQITCANQRATFIECFKLITALSISIDENVTFDEHINNICLKASRQIGALQRLTDFIDMPGRTTFFFTKASPPRISVIFSSFGISRAAIS